MKNTIETAKATELVAKIRANVDAFYADDVDYDAFSQRQRAAWDEVKAAGPDVDALVCKTLRERS